MTSSTTGEWFYGDGPTQRGPVPRSTLRAMAERGELRPDALVWSEGMSQWTPARQVPGLFDGLHTTPPPLPPVAQFAQPALAPPLPDTAGMRMLLPVNRSGWAIAAGYLGLFAVLMFPAPFAFIVGLIALRDLRRQPELHGAGRAWFGLVMGALFTLPLILMIVALSVKK